MSNIADSKVQSVTGHRSMRMTEHYTHFDTRQFAEVRDVQANLLAVNNPVKTVQMKTKPGKTGEAVKATKTAGKTVKPKTANIKKSHAKKPVVNKKARA